MPREITNHDRILEAFAGIEIVSELLEKLPNGEFKNELDMDIILFGRSYRGKKVGPYARLLEFDAGETIIAENTWESGIFYMLVDGRLEASVIVDGQRSVLGEVPKGNSFGEMALLAGSPRSATISVPQGATAAVLEITRPALRLLRKLPRFGKAIDRSYRSYGQTLTVSELRDFSDGSLSSEQLKRLSDSSRFAVYEKGQVLFREGDPINRVVFVRNGWVQRITGAKLPSHAAGLLAASEDSMGSDFMGAGNTMGLEAAATESIWKYTAVVKGRAEVFEIAASRLREDADLSHALLPVLESASGRGGATAKLAEDKNTLSAAMHEIETGVVDAVNLLVMDMAKCIRCGNCSLACHHVHGHARLVRRGIHIERPTRIVGGGGQNVLVPEVCMHCNDPECLTGCPTGAIARFPDGQIDIHAKSCIGCGDCATQCPYNAITMVPRDATAPEAAGIAAKLRRLFSVGPAKLPEPVTQTEGLLAVKCNLCQGTSMNPEGASGSAYSCEENCPTGALVRVNPREYFGEIEKTIGLIKKSKTHAIGVNIHKADWRAVMWHVVGTAIVLLFGGAAAAATALLSQDSALLRGGWLTMRWTTGILGLAGIVWVMAYPVRKQIYRRRAGALRYWMLSHIYLGVAAAVLLLIHGGTSSGGLLTTSLMITFDLVIASGVWGSLCYAVVPRLMTRIEREPLLLEDLEARRTELRRALGDAASRDGVGRLVKENVIGRFASFSYLMKQFGGGDLSALLADARQEFRPLTEGLSKNDGAKLLEAVENAATLRRIDALCYLHNALKSWLAPHVIFTSLMLALMLVHIVQVIYFNVR